MPRERRFVALQRRQVRFAQQRNAREIGGGSQRGDVDAGELARERGA